MDIILSASPAESNSDLLRISCRDLILDGKKRRLMEVFS